MPQPDPRQGDQHNHHRKSHRIQDNGVNQVQINEKAGVTFAATLRSILRQDRMSSSSARSATGRPPRSRCRRRRPAISCCRPLHTNDSLAADNTVARPGNPGFLISSSLLGILAQRLVRVLCPHCKQRAELGAKPPSGWKVMLRAFPCRPTMRPWDATSATPWGYKGRTGIFELASVNETVRKHDFRKRIGRGAPLIFPGRRHEIHDPKWDSKRSNRASPLPTSFFAW